MDVLTIAEEVLTVEVLTVKGYGAPFPPSYTPPPPGVCVTRIAPSARVHRALGAALDTIFPINIGPSDRPPGALGRAKSATSVCTKGYCFAFS
jgi:hypothetical protein